MIDVVAGSPWVLLVVFLVAGLDAIVPLSPSETTLITASVLAGATGEPHIVLVIVAAAGGAFCGDLLSYRIGVHAGAGVLRRLQGKARGVAAYEWARRMLHARGAGAGLRAVPAGWAVGVGAGRRGGRVPGGALSSVDGARGERLGHHGGAHRFRQRALFRRCAVEGAAARLRRGVAAAGRGRGGAALVSGARRGG